MSDSGRDEEYVRRLQARLIEVAAGRELEAIARGKPVPESVREIRALVAERVEGNEGDVDSETVPARPSSIGAPEAPRLSSARYGQGRSGMASSPCRVCGTVTGACLSQGVVDRCWDCRECPCVCSAPIVESPNSFPSRKEWDAARHDRGDTSAADGYESSDYVDGWNEALNAVESARAHLREARRPQRIMLAPSAEPAWKINSIKVSNIHVPPPTVEYKRREEEAAACHDPLIARTMLGGPGNRRQVVGCACHAPEIRDAASWCAHIGVPGGERFLKPLLSLQDVVRDALDYPGDRALTALRAAYDATKVKL